MLISSRWSDSIPKFSHRDFNSILDCHTAGSSRYFNTSIADDSDSKLAAQLETHGRHKMALLYVVFTPSDQVVSLTLEDLTLLDDQRWETRTGKGSRNDD
jgi:hypothetical protein